MKKVILILLLSATAALAQDMRPTRQEELMMDSVHRRAQFISSRKKEIEKTYASLQEEYSGLQAEEAIIFSDVALIYSNAAARLGCKRVTYDGKQFVKGD